MKWIGLSPEPGGEETYGVVPICGDELLLYDESCDDGNFTNEDGYDSTCREEIEANYTGVPHHHEAKYYISKCTTSRGNGSQRNNFVSMFASGEVEELEGAEECDYGNRKEGEGFFSTF